jgi:hypothetical protein
VLTRVSTNAITVFNLEQAESFALVITPAMEVNELPAVQVATVEKSRLHWFVAKKLEDESPHFIRDFTSCVRDKSFEQGSYEVNVIG